MLEYLTFLLPFDFTDHRTSLFTISMVIYSFPPLSYLTLRNQVYVINDLKNINEDIRIMILKLLPYKFLFLIKYYQN